MSDDLVNELLNLGPDDSGFREVGVAAATALTEARAEIERLTEQARRDREYSASQARQHAKLVNLVLAAESELSTLRARVREVVGPFGKIDPFETAFSKQGKIFRLDYNASLLDQLTFEHFRAARQLMEEVK